MQELYQVSTIHRTPDTTGGVQLNACIKSNGSLTFFVSWKGNKEYFTNYADARKLYITKCYEHGVNADLNIRITNLYGTRNVVKTGKEDPNSTAWFNFDTLTVDTKQKYGNDLCLGHCESVAKIKTEIFKYMESY